MRRIKAICWWCHQHSQQAWQSSPQGDWETYSIPNRYSTDINWNEFHTPTRYPNETD
ncbi:hypothetical protein [Bifidobacterium aquikefiricola]|uniref:hypothetical protein n=1 Tax=Bifidobacterium TaxID=1678 RepID=UPI003857549F